MIAVNSKESSACQKKAEMLGFDPANTFARRPIAVLEGEAAWDFVERVKAMENVPYSDSPSKESRKEWKEYFRKQMLRELNEKFDN